MRGIQRAKVLGAADLLPRTAGALRQLPQGEAPATASICSQRLAEEGPGQARKRNRHADEER